MNVLIENGTISEMACGNNFAYVLNDESQFLLTEYKVLQSQGTGNFVKCMKLLYNGRPEFYYLVSGLKSLTEMIPALDAEHFMTVVSNLLANIIDVKENGFLSCRNIDLSFERIYVDTATYKVGLIYLPVKRHFFQDEPAFENELRTGLVRLISNEDRLSSPKTLRFREDLSNGMLSVEDLYHRAKGGAGTAGSSDRKQWDEPHAGGNGTLQIIAMNAPERVVLIVDKPEYIIGKNRAAVDGAVSFNKMISRVHCKVITAGGQYSIEDLNSANGTYVNHVRLQPRNPYPIKNGDIIRLANSDFQVLIN